MKISEIEFDMRDDDERESILAIWAQMLGDQDWPIQIISFSKPSE